MKKILFYFILLFTLFLSFPHNNKSFAACIQDNQSGCNTYNGGNCCNKSSVCTGGTVYHGIRSGGTCLPANQPGSNGACEPIAGKCMSDQACATSVDYPGGADTSYSCASGVCCTKSHASAGSSGGGGVSVPSVGSFLDSFNPGVPHGGTTGLNNVLKAALSLLILIAIILCLIYLIWGGYFWITSQGDKQRLEQARQRIIYALIGLLVVFISFLLLSIIYAFFFPNAGSGIIQVPLP